MAATAFLIVVTVVRFEGLVAWAFLFPGCCTYYVVVAVIALVFLLS